ncbi:MAG: sodium:proton exchanger [Blastopirellula sp.]|nr:MAG: sodium:proton exchanger [Blastopirellula sp.]
MDDPLLYLAGILGLGVAAQWIAWRLNLPSIILLLAFGFLAGLVGSPDDMIEQEILLAIVSLSVAVILFEGGMSLKLGELKEAGSAVLRLITIGAFVTWVLATLAAWYIMDFSIPLAALVGAILVVTGPTVIAPLLNHIRPAKKIGAIAKWEGIVIDPIGAVLAVLIFEVVLASSGEATSEAFWVVTRTIFFGVTLGVASAWTLVLLLKRFWIPDFLHNTFFLAVILVIFAVSNNLQPESGLLTVTVIGIALANQKQITVRHIFEFKENLRVLLISCLFIVLAARITPLEMFAVGWNGLFFLLFLIVVVRPASIFISTFRSDLSKQEKIFLCFLAPRGIVAAAVASVFAMELFHKMHDGDIPVDKLGPLTELAEKADQLVPLTFLVIVGTVTFYGLAAAPIARMLGLSSPSPQGVLFASAERWVRELAKVIQDAGFQVLLVDTNYRNVSTAKMEGIPAHCASILSEFVTEEINLGGIGRLLAVTPNDEVNALACMEFVHIFGRKEVYQLDSYDSGSGRRESVSNHLRGRDLFAEEVDFYQLSRRFAAGAQVKKTSLSEEFTFQDFNNMYGESAQVLFIIDDNSNLEILTSDSTTDPQPGQTIIAVVDPVEEAAEQTDG